MIRRLDPDKDESLLREAFSWDQGKPSWYRQMDRVFGPDNVEDFLKLINDPLNAFIGIFNPQLVGLIVVALASKDRYAAHLWAKRGTGLPVLVEAGCQVLNDMFGLGMVEGFVYVAEKNRTVRRLCEAIGFSEDGIVMYRGTYRGKIIKWIRLSCSRQVEQRIAA